MKMIGKSAVAGSAPQPHGGLRAVHLRHHPVQAHDIRTLLGHFLEQLATIRHRRYPVSSFFQGEPRHQSDVRVVFGKDDVQAHWLNPFLVMTPQSRLPRK
jgi:hypothetical protein